MEVQGVQVPEELVDEGDDAKVEPSRHFTHVPSPCPTVPAGHSYTASFVASQEVFSAALAGAALQTVQLTEIADCDLE